MPEGHTIHRLARDHNKAFAGKNAHVSSPQGRFADEAKKVSGKKLLHVEAYGKHLFYVWPKNQRVHVHLGLYGKFRFYDNPPPEPQGAIRLRFIGKQKSFDLVGPNRCELQTPDEYQKVVDRLGSDPLRQDADPEFVWNRIHKSRAAIGTLLLNQSIIAGVGNVYRAEILFLMGIHPERSGAEFNRETFNRMWTLTVELMNVGVKYNRIITIDRQAAGKPLSQVTNAERLLCYKKSNCTRCGTKIKTWTLGARTMYACEKCQV